MVRCMGNGGVAPPFLTSVLDGGGLAPEPVWTLWSREKSLPLPGIEPWLSSLYPVVIQTKLLKIIMQNIFFI
jgi:hypothetical protein